MDTKESTKDTKGRNKRTSTWISHHEINKEQTALNDLSSSISQMINDKLTIDQGSHMDPRIHPQVLNDPKIFSSVQSR